jgi:hypothetical protein
MSTKQKLARMAGGAQLSTLPHSLLHGALATPILGKIRPFEQLCGVSRGPALFVMRADELIAPINDISSGFPPERY